MIGIIGYAVPTGLGTMVREIRKHLGVTKQFTIANHDFDPPWNMEWAQDTFLNGADQTNPFSGKFKWEVQRDDLEYWVREEEIDTVISIETPFGENTFKWCQELGVKVVLIPMWEFFNPNMPQFRNVDLYVCPSFKCFQEVPFDNKVFLPYPVDTEAIPFRHRPGPAKVFVHNAGTGGMNGRKGTYQTITAFLKADIPDTKLIVRSQRPMADVCKSSLEMGSLGDMDEWFKAMLDPRIEVRIGSTPEVADLYEEGDVLIYPSLYDGHALVALEGMCAGMPVITTDAAPMNEFFDADYPLLTRVFLRRPAGLINPHCEQNYASITDLTDKIRWCATNDLSQLSRRNREIVEKEHSWTALRERWLTTLTTVVSPSAGRI